LIYLSFFCIPEKNIRHDLTRRTKQQQQQQQKEREIQIIPQVLFLFYSIISKEKRFKSSENDFVVEL